MILLFIVGLAKFFQVWIFICLNSGSTIFVCSFCSEVDYPYLSRCKPTRLLCFAHTRAAFIFNGLFLFRSNFLLQCFQVLLSELLVNEWIRFIPISRYYSCCSIFRHGNDLTWPWTWVIPDIVVIGYDFILSYNGITRILPYTIASLLWTTSSVCHLSYRI